MSNASLVSSGHPPTRATPSRACSSCIQHGNDNSLRLAWTGWNWNGDGHPCLSIWIHRAAAHQPLQSIPARERATTLRPQYSPDEHPTAAPAALARDYMVWVLNSTNVRRRCIGTAAPGTSSKTLTRKQVFINTQVRPVRTDILRPLALGPHRRPRSRSWVWRQKKNASKLCGARRPTRIRHQFA